MDSELIKQYAANCRSLAEKADPFIKRRLLALADRYEGRLSQVVLPIGRHELGAAQACPVRSER